MNKWYMLHAREKNNYSRHSEAAYKASRELGQYQQVEKISTASINSYITFGVQVLSPFIIIILHFGCKRSCDIINVEKQWRDGPYDIVAVFQCYTSTITKISQVGVYDHIDLQKLILYMSYLWWKFVRK